MSKDQSAALEKLRQSFESLSSEHAKYWDRYSSYDTWEFWVCLFMFIAPLAALWWLMDKKRAFFLGFFGYSVHICFTYIDNLGTLRGWWAYPYKIFPFLPISFVLDASLVPVAFMLAYQWCTEHGKSRYLYLILLSAVFAFVVKPVMSLMNLFKLYEWWNYFYLFLGYLVVTFFALLVIDLFFYLRKIGTNKKPCA